MRHLETRAKIYDILASAFSRPGDGLASEILAGRFMERVQRTLLECCDIHADCCFPPGLLMKIGERFQSGKWTSVLELETEYMRLFVTDFPSAWAPPYESYYTEGRMMGQAAADCVAVYKQDGISPSEGGELPDHIVTQLEYLRFLSLAEAKEAELNDQSSIRVYEKRARDFYQEHILSWVPEFCSRIQAHSRSLFYTEMAKLLKRFILLEYRNISRRDSDGFEGVREHEINLA